MVSVGKAATWPALADKGNVLLLTASADAEVERLILVPLAVAILPT